MRKKNAAKLPVYPANLKHLHVKEIEEASVISTIEQKLVCYKNALLTPTNHLFVNGRNIPSGFITGYNKKKLALLKQIYLFMKFRFFTKPEFHKGEFLWVHDVWSKNYYHWLCETLPRIVVLHEQYPNAIVVLPVDFKALSFIEDSLRLLNLKYQWIDQEKTAYQFEYLATVFMPVLFAEINPDFQHKMRDAIISALAIPKHPPIRKVYVSRSKARYRKIKNENELLPILTQYGYEIIHAEDLSFKEQVLLFSQTKSLITTHGAAHTNTMFMQPGSSVMEIRNKQWTSQPFCFWQLANMFELKWEYLLADPVNEISNFNDIYIPAGLFEEELLKFENINNA